jgi:predicted metal-dependent peptidase
MVITEEVRKAFQDAHAYLLKTFSFAGLVIYNLKIIFTKNIETAAVNGRHELLVNPDFFLRFNVKERAFILAHEAYHIIFRDILRAKGLGLTRSEEWELWNVVADGVNNHALIDILKLLPTEINELDPVLLSKIQEILKKLGVQITMQDLENMTKEEIYRLFLTKGGSIKDGGVLSGDISEGKDKHPVDGDVIMEGDPGLYKDPTVASDPNKVKDRINRIVDIARKYHNMRAGKLPDYLERLIDELLESKVTWEKYIPRVIRDRIGQEVISTWMRPSRRMPEVLPGYRFLTAPKVWVLVDVSGSIDDKALKEFASEIYAVTSYTGNKVIVIAWDTEVKDEFELLNPEDVRRLKFKGGGGTLIKEVLKNVAPRFDYHDVVIILTDGHIFDLEDGGVQYLLNQLGGKASAAVWGTKDVKYEATPWINVEIN